MNKTCAQRIQPTLDRRLEDFATLHERSKNDDSAYDQLCEYPLSVSKYIVVKIELSTGGPADWLECKVDQNVIESITYHFADWLDHSEKVLDGEEFRFAEQFCDFFLPFS